MDGCKYLDEVSTHAFYSICTYSMLLKYVGRYDFVQILERNVARSFGPDVFIIQLETVNGLPTRKSENKFRDR